MSLEDFQAGFWRAVLSRAEAHASRDEMLAARPLAVSRIETALANFYASNATRIESAAGVPGVDVSIAYQVGIEFGTLLMRQRATTNVSDWGAVLAGRIVTAARDRPRLRIRRDAAGALTVDEEAGGGG